MLPRSSLRLFSVFPALKQLLTERNRAIDQRMRQFEDSLSALNTKHGARLSMTVNRLLPEQETRVDLILKELIELNQFEKRAFFAVFEEKRKKGFDTAKGEGNYAGNAMDTGSIWPYNHPRNIEYQLESGTKGQLGLHGFTSSFTSKLASGEAFQSLESVEISTSAAVPETAQKKVEEVPKEEKTSFNLMLKGFSVEGKLKVIKEVKTVLNLGLKEAKEKVEGAAKDPVILFKNVAKESVKAAVEKLTAAGADLEWK